MQDGLHAELVDGADDLRQIRRDELRKHRRADERPAVVAVVAVDADEIHALVHLLFRQLDRGVAFPAGLGVQLRRLLVELHGKLHHLVARQHPESALTVEPINHHPVAEALASARDDLAVEMAAQVGRQMDGGPIIGRDDLIPNVEVLVQMPFALCRCGGVHLVVSGPAQLKRFLLQLEDQFQVGHLVGDLAVLDGGQSLSTVHFHGERGLLPFFTNLRSRRRCRTQAWRK